MMEFHVSRNARDFYQFSQSLFSTNGNVIFTNFQAAKIFAQKINAQRDLLHYPEQAVHAGQINGMGLIDEMMHVVFERYRQQRSTSLLEDAMTWVKEQLGNETVDQILNQFAKEFPPLAVYRKEISLEDYFKQSTDMGNGILRQNQLMVLEELIVLWLANINPAFSPYLELFDDTNLDHQTDYKKIIQSLHDFLQTQPFFGPENQNLMDMLRSPAIVVPHSIPGQLEYIRTHWGYLLGEHLLRLLNSLDFIKEEEKVFFSGSGISQVPKFTGLELDPERFSPDKDWMPNLVLMAKNAYVWLDQLSKNYHRSIKNLDEIPDEELDRLAQWGMTGLWLIGLWERSPASKRIKQLRGNTDAVASAYSLYDYHIAGDIGGEASLKNLQQRAWQRGIRLASDMVPNHMGIDSRWLIEHPDWFISLDNVPYPSYSFNGPDLSWDERVGIQIEDHYFDNTDAAVVFKRFDRWTGDLRYIYHGNDGTSMPWNDTAQLNFLNPAVREAVIQTILEVARRFPIIRFDAAMTLAKKHFQRLWYPEPGSGGDIPSRAGLGLTKDQFDAAFPEEFWREVVDRVSQEQPDTLLLAEAFWLMEGYFVRTLGMHRVYNSAFMNMLRDEKNQEYRQVIKNTIEFDPEILKRYVNFMSNPDERTSVDQFGKGDKYFGICTLMATMPGLPMFGHGQIEGFTEKYGMEYQRAYWDEYPDRDLVTRHEREIFPLLRRRYLFAEVENFYLYDFFTSQGFVNEDVFAYSNRAGDERSLVLYHNKYSSTQGWIRTSASFPVKDQRKRTLVNTTLGAGLGLPNNENSYVIFTDHVSGLEYIRNCHEIHQQGLYTELEAYKIHVFLNFRIVEDNEAGDYYQLAQELDGKGVPKMDEAYQDILLRPIHEPFQKLVNAGQIQWIIDHRLSPETPDRKAAEKEIASMLEEVERKAYVFLEKALQKSSGSGDPDEISAKIHQLISSELFLPVIEERLTAKKQKLKNDLTQYLAAGPSPVDMDSTPLLQGQASIWSVIVTWAIIQNLGQIIQPEDYEEISLNLLDEWKLKNSLAKTLVELGTSADEAQRSLNLIRLLVRYHNWWQEDISTTAKQAALLQKWLNDTELQNYIGVNRYQDTLWFNQERFEELIWWFFTIATIELLSTDVTQTKFNKQCLDIYQSIQHILTVERESGFQLDRLVELAGS